MPRQTQDELEAHLREQLEFLEASADSYDAGFEGEAKRLSTTIRVLVHDTSASTSLLSHLGRKSTPFYDSALPAPREDNLATHAGLILTAATPTGPKYIPFLDSHAFSSPRMVPFDDWWNAIVFVDDLKARIARRDLVLAIANKDGGAHVDDRLNDAYARLTRFNSLGWESRSAAGVKPFPPPHLAAARQIAHEVLKTLRPGYTKNNPPMGAHGYFGAVQIYDSAYPTGRIVAPGAPLLIQPATTSPVMGRNDPCPCGSGRRYKRCHGKSVS